MGIAEGEEYVKGEISSSTTFTCCFVGSAPRFREPKWGATG